MMDASGPSVGLAERLLQEESSLRDRCTGKAFTFLSLSICLGFALVLNLVACTNIGGWQHLKVQNPTIDMVSQFSPLTMARQFPQTARAQQFIQPVRARQSIGLAKVRQFLQPARAQFDPLDRFAQMERLLGAPKKISVIGTEDNFARKKQKARDLEPWLEAKGLPEQDVELSYSVSEGRGLTASVDIETGTKLLYIPDAAIITVEKAAVQLGEQRCAGLSEWSILAVWLAGERARGASSPFAAYIALLPRVCGGILEWEDSEVEDLLAGSPSQAEAIGRRRSISEVTPELLDLFPERQLNEENIRWAFSMLFSRSMRLQALDAETKVKVGEIAALCPWADMMNHRPGIKGFFGYDKETKNVVLTTDRNYAEGDEVFISYGERSSSELLLSYGFVPPAQHPDEAVEITLGLQNSDPLKDEKEKALRRRDLAPVTSFPVRETGLPEEMLAFAAFVATPIDPQAMDESDPYILVEQLAQETIDRAEEGRTNAIFRAQMPWVAPKWSVDPSIAAREFVKDVIENIKAGYKNSLEEDLRLAKGADTRGAMAETKEGRRTAAAAVRSRERLILAETESELNFQEVEKAKGPLDKLPFGSLSSNLVESFSKQNK